MKQNMIGLEAEVLLRKADSSLVYPSKYGFDTDDYPLLAEIRALPGGTVKETFINFITEFEKFKFDAEKQKLFVDLAGSIILPIKLHNEALRRMGSKEISKSKNIYSDMDILSVSDDIVDKDLKSSTCGQIISTLKTCGLHLHFSSSEEYVERYYRYNPVEFSKKVNGIKLSETLYKRSDNEEKTSHRLSVITMPVIRKFVRVLDETYFDKYVKKESKFRRKGFYEIKDHGFEYRSLPFNNEILEDLPEILTESFKLFNLL